MNKSSQQMRRSGALKPSPNACINKLANFEFVNISADPDIDTLTRRNPRNSFYAQKFKKLQCRPSTSMPDSSKRSPVTAPIRNEEPKNMGMMGSFFVNTRPNTRRISNSLANYHAQLLRRNPSQSNHNNTIKHKISPQRQQPKDTTHRDKDRQPVRKNTGETFYSQIMGQMNEYLSMIKLSAHKRNEERVSQAHDRRYASSECKARDVEKIYFNDGNLSIKGIHTNPNRLSFNLRRDRKNFQSYQDQQKSFQEQLVFSGQKVMTQELISSPVPESNAGNVIKFSSVHEKQSNMSNLKGQAENYQFILMPKVQKSPSKQLSKSKYLADYFGVVKNNTSLQQIQKLKALYYRDLIWKIWFNSGWKVKIDTYVDAPRFFVGRGNNSKLVKMIMGKRWWWKLETKQDNSNFLWTQLKIYSAIQSQQQYEKISQVEPTDTVKQDEVDEQSSLQLVVEKTETNEDQLKQTTNTNQLRTLSKSNGRTNQQNQDPIIEKGNGSEEQMEDLSGRWWDSKSNMDDRNTYLLTPKKYRSWLLYISDSTNRKKEVKNGETLLSRKKLQQKIVMNDTFPNKVTNHLQYSRLIGNKKALFRTMSTYYELSKKISKFLPLTYHVQNGLEDPEYLKFLGEYYRRAKQENNTLWILKPGEMSNRGCGIKVCDDINQIKKVLRNRKTHTNGKSFTYIIQQYIRQPFLYQGRKFDIRHYIMINSTYGTVRGYFYQQGYIRTTSYKYSNKNQDSLVHLTNDAVQKHCKDYGKFQKGNKVSYEQFEKYLKANPQYKQKGYSFYEKILPKIRQISIDIMNASFYTIDPKRKGNNFEIFGLDIMIDCDFRPWLIEVNTNPCLELSSPVLSKVIPKMLDNAFAISLDPLFPPPADISISSKRNTLPENYINENGFELVFDENVHGAKLNRLYQKVKDQLSQMEGYGSDEEAYESAEDDCDAQY